MHVLVHYNVCILSQKMKCSFYSRVVGRRLSPMMMFLVSILSSCFFLLIKQRTKVLSDYLILKSTFIKQNIEWWILGGHHNITMFSAVVFSPKQSSAFPLLSAIYRTIFSFQSFKSKSCFPRHAQLLSFLIIS